MPILKTLEEVAKHFERNKYTIQAWRRRGMPGSPKNWDTKAIQKWRDENIGPTNKESHNKAIDRAESSIKKRMLEADAERKEALAKIEQVKAQKMLEDSLVDLHDVERFLSEFLTDLRRRLMRVPERIKGEFPAKYRQSVSTAITGRIELELQHSFNWLERMADLIEE